MDYAAIWAGLEVIACIAFPKFMSAEVIANGLLIYLQLFGNAIYAARRQLVLDVSQLIESEIHKPVILVKKTPLPGNTILA